MEITTTTVDWIIAIATVVTGIATVVTAVIAGLAYWHSRPRPVIDVRISGRQDINDVMLDIRNPAPFALVVDRITVEEPTDASISIKEGDNMRSVIVAAITTANKSIDSNFEILPNGRQSYTFFLKTAAKVGKARLIVEMRRMGHSKVRRLKLTGDLPPRAV